MRQPVRQHSPATGKTDVDRVERARLIRIFMGSLVGLVLGGVAALLGMASRGWGVGTAILVTSATWAMAALLPLGLSALGGGAARQLYNPSGRTTPPKREYSHAESLVVRGLYQEAIDAFEVAIGDDPSDPTPYLRIARVNRDHLGGFESAARWFKRALAESSIPPGLAYLATRELVEIYVTKLADPRRAAPLLARMAEERAGTPEGAWASEELVRVKESMNEERDA